MTAFADSVISVEQALDELRGGKSGDISSFGLQAFTYTFHWPISDV